MNLYKFDKKHVIINDNDVIISVIYLKKLLKLFIYINKLNFFIFVNIYIY